MANGRGGRRPGAGQPKKAVTRAQELAKAQGMILEAAPRIIQSLIDAAERGDTSAGKYLLDRLFGRVIEATMPLIDTIGTEENPDE